MKIKLKASVPEILIGVLLTVAVFAMGMMFESSRHPAINAQVQDSSQTADQITKQSSTDERLADYAFALDVLTAFLVIATIGLLSATKRSAKISERALTELERPYLFILDYNWLLIEKAKINGFKCGLVYSVANGGKLPAFIKAVKYGLIFGESIPAPQDAPPVHDLLTAPLIAGGEQRQVVQGFNDDGGDPAIECKIRDGQALIPATAFKTGRVIAKISIEYDGPITTGHVTTACWEWHPVKYAFTQFGGLEHNQRT